MYIDRQDISYKPTAIGLGNVLAYLDKINQEGIKETSPLEIFIYTQKTTIQDTLPLEHTLYEIVKDYPLHPEFEKIITSLEQTDVLKPEGDRYQINTDNLEKAIEDHNNKIRTLDIFDLPAKCQGNGFTS